MAERKNRRLIPDPVAEHVNPREPAHGRRLDQGILQCWITERIPLLLHVDPQHGGQRVRQPATFATGLGGRGARSGCQGLEGDHLILVSQGFTRLVHLLAMGCSEYLYPSICRKETQHLGGYKGQISRVSAGFFRFP